MIVVILAFLASLLLALLAVPVLAAAARFVGLVDHPDDRRKLHANATPLVGGVAVYIVVMSIAPLAIHYGQAYQDQDWYIDVGKQLLGWIPVDFVRRELELNEGDSWELMGLALGSTVLLIVGLLDDRFGIRGRQKLFGQFVAITVLIIFDYHFDQIEVAGFKIILDKFSVLFVYAWMLAAINSVNLLDGADGIAGTIGIVMSLSLCLMAIYLNQMVNAIVAISVAGGLLGFLRYNFPPAKVYLGDTGSMLIGFVLGALAIRCTFKQNSAVAFFAPLALLAIPFIDTAAAIIRRQLTGRSIFAVDRGHLHHSLMKHGYSPRISLLWVMVLCLTTATGGVLSLVSEQSEYALVSIGIVIAVMLICRIFGVAEFRLVTRKARSFSKTLFERRNVGRSPIEQSAVHVQGSRDWQQTWDQLAHFADEHGLLELTLDLNAPWLHESFHGTHRRSDLPRGSSSEWYVQLPLIADQRLFGRVQILGSGQEDLSHHEILQRVLTVTANIESGLLDPAESTPADVDTTDSSHDSAEATVNDEIVPSSG